MKRKIFELLSLIFVGVIVFSSVYFPVTIFAMDELTKAGLTKNGFLVILIVVFFVISIPPLIVITKDDADEILKKICTILLVVFSAASFVYLGSELYQDNTTIIIINSVK